MDTSPARSDCKPNTSVKVVFPLLPSPFASLAPGCQSDAFRSYIFFHLAYPGKPNSYTLLTACLLLFFHWWTIRTLFSFGSTLRNCCRSAYPHSRNWSSLLDSLDWSRKFEIFTISRLSLHSSGIPRELVKTLTDEDMQVIAEQIAEMIVMEPIEKIAEFVARLYLAEKGT